jgi:hypothetical protein
MLLAYLFTRLEDLKMISSMLAFVLTFPVAISTVMCFEDYLKEKLNKPIKILYPVWLFFILLWAAIPTTKEAAFIWIAPQIVENGAVKETVKNIPELNRLCTEYLKNVLKEKVEGQK